VSVLKVLYYPEPVLKQKAKAVTDFTKITSELIRDMVETMYAKAGVGLAAPQIGLSQQIAVLCPSMKKGEERFLINPVILEATGEEIGTEGCLSVPGASAEIRRATEIKFQAMDLKGKTFTEKATGFYARVIQHELDHLNGTLIIDRVDFVRRQQLLSTYKLI